MLSANFGTVNGFANDGDRVRHSIGADICPKISATEMCMPILQILIVSVFLFYLRDMPPPLVLLTLFSVSSAILLIIGIKRRKLVVLRVVEDDFRKYSGKDRTFSIRIHKRLRSSYEKRLDGCTHSLNSHGLIKECEQDIVINRFNSLIDRALFRYTGICGFISRWAMELSGVKLNQLKSDGKSDSKSLVQEWIFDIEQEEDRLQVLKEAPDMIVSSISMSIKYGYLPRLIQKFRQKNIGLEETCMCGKPVSQCINNDGKVIKDIDGIGRRLF